MALTQQEQARLDQIEADIARFANIVAVTSGLGASASSQGISNSFTDTQIKMAFSMLPRLRAARDRLLAIQDNIPLPPKPGVTLSNYSPL